MKKHAIKVLAIVSQLNRGGLESRLMDIIRNLDFSRVQMDIYTYRMDAGLLDEEAKSYGCKIYYNKPLTVKNMFEYVHYFAAFLKKHPEYKIVHAHQDAWCTVFCKGAKLAGVPVRIAHSRTSIASVSIENLAKNIIKIPAKKYATHYFAVSDHAGEWLFGKGNVKRGKVEVWPNAIECKKYELNGERRKQKREELGIEDKLVILHVGNFTPYKNHEKVVRVFYEVCKKRKDAVLILVGKECTPNARALAKELHLTKRIKFLGVREDINELLWAADIFLFPSIFEGMPGAVIEAQAAGLPCLVSDAVTKQIKITPLVKLLSLKLSDKRWAKELLDIQKMGRSNQLEVMRQKGFDVEILVERLTKFYENATKDERD